MKTLQELSIKPMLVLSQNTTLQEVAKALCKKEVGCCLLSDERGHIVGIVTDRDLMCASLAKSRWPFEAVHKVMSSALIYALETSSISEVVDLMKAFGIRRVPIVRSLENGKQRCMGLLTVDDLILQKVISIDDLATILDNQLLPHSSFLLKKQNALRSQSLDAELDNSF